MELAVGEVHSQKDINDEDVSQGFGKDGQKDDKQGQVLEFLEKRGVSSTFLFLFRNA
jgi:hypothetical protein